MNNFEVRVWDKEQNRYLKIGDSEGEASPRYYQRLYFVLVGKKDDDGYDYEIDSEIQLYSDETDKHGKLICEGDVLKVNKFKFDSSHELPENLIVKFFKGSFQLFRGQQCLMGLYLSYIEDCEIIGNTCENPEYLMAC